MKDMHINNVLSYCYVIDIQPVAFAWGGVFPQSLKAILMGE